MTLNRATGNDEFIADGDTTRSIYWNPNKLDLEVPQHTGNEERPYLPPSITVLPLPEEASDNIEIYPVPEENGFQDYILILPIPNIPPIYVYIPVAIQVAAVLAVPTRSSHIAFLSMLLGSFGLSALLGPILGLTFLG